MEVYDAQSYYHKQAIGTYAVKQPEPQIEIQGFPKIGIPLLWYPKWQDPKYKYPHSKVPLIFGNFPNRNTDAGVYCVGPQCQGTRAQCNFTGERDVEDATALNLRRLQIQVSPMKQGRV